MKKRKKQQKKANREMWIAFAIFAVIVIALVCVIVIGRSTSVGSTVSASTEAQYEIPNCPFDIDGFETVESSIHGAINDSLTLTCIGKYSGSYVEDGSDETVSDVLAILVENTSDLLVEYAEIKINCGEEDAFFELNALPSGSSVLILESSRMQYMDYMDFRSKICFGFTEAACDDLAEDFRITSQAGEIEITNISDRDFTEPLTICYKTKLQDKLYLGGIAYRVMLDDSLASGQTRNIPAEHLTFSQIIYVSYGS